MPLQPLYQPVSFSTCELLRVVRIFEKVCSLCYHHSLHSPKKKEGKSPCTRNKRKFDFPTFLTLTGIHNSNGGDIKFLRFSILWMEVYWFPIPYWKKVRENNISVVHEFFFSRNRLMLVFNNPLNACKLKRNEFIIRWVLLQDVSLYR